MLTFLLLFATAYVSYYAGSARTFAFCGYWDETIGQSFRTLLPWCGNRP